MRNTACIAALSGKRLGHEAAKPGGLGDHRQVLQQDRGDALVVVGVGDGEGDLGFVTCAAAGKVLADADERIARLGDEGDVQADVVDRRTPQLVVGNRRSLAEEPKVAGGGIEPLVKRAQALDVRRPGRADAHRPARRQQDVTLERSEQRVSHDDPTGGLGDPPSSRLTDATFCVKIAGISQTVAGSEFTGESYEGC